MEKHDSSSAISPTTPAAKSQGVVETPTSPAPYGPEDAPEIRRTSWVWTSPAVIALAIGLTVTPVVCVVMGLWLGDKFPPAAVSGPSAATPLTGDWSQTPVTDEEHICARFVRLKNADDPAAFELLGPAPAVPDGPVTKAQADRMQTDFFLRQDVHFTGVGRDKRTGALVLYAKGNVSAPTMPVQTANGVESAQRTMSNPDLTVEVRDGRICGVSSDLHLGP